MEKKKYRVFRSFSPNGGRGRLARAHTHTHDSIFISIALGPGRGFFFNFSNRPPRRTPLIYGRPHTTTAAPFCCAQRIPPPTTMTTGSAGQGYGADRCASVHGPTAAAAGDQACPDRPQNGRALVPGRGIGAHTCSASPPARSPPPPPGHICPLRGTRPAPPRARPEVLAPRRGGGVSLVPVGSRPPRRPRDRRSARAGGSSHPGALRLLVRDQHVPRRQKSNVGAPPFFWWGGARGARAKKRQVHFVIFV